MATTSNTAMRKKTPFYVSIFLIRDTSIPGGQLFPPGLSEAISDQCPEDRPVVHEPDDPQYGLYHSNHGRDQPQALCVTAPTVVGNTPSLPVLPPEPRNGRMVVVRNNQYSASDSVKEKRRHGR
jgi:hypothetical protein